MSDNDRKELNLPFGDLIAAVAYCKNLKHLATPGSSDESDLLTRVKTRLQECDLGRKSKRAKKLKHLIGNQNAAKEKRRIELGWQSDSVTKGHFIKHRLKGDGGIRHEKCEVFTMVSAV